MFAQKGTFTIHGTDARPLEDQCPSVIRKVSLPTAAEEGAREFLEHSDFNIYTIYPDLVGMARYIRRRAFGY
jgi:hypothetical protein